MATDTGPLDEVRLEELLRILEIQKSSSSIRREKFQAKLRHLKEKQDNLQYRIVSRMNKDGINVDIDTIKKRAQQAVLNAAQSYDNDDDTSNDTREKTFEFSFVQEPSGIVHEDKVNETDVAEEKTEGIQAQCNTSASNTNEKSSRKLSSKSSSAHINTKLEKIQEETIEQSSTVSKGKGSEVKEKKVAMKNGKKLNSEKRFKNAANATKFVAKVSRRKSSQKLKDK